MQFSRSEEIRARAAHPHALTPAGAFDVGRPPVGPRLEMADRYGLAEAWIGERFTAPWEPVPTPDLLIAQALMRTKNIMLGTGAHLHPFHHPVELAHRVAYLDHMAQGRYMFGIGSGGLLSGHELFDVDFDEGEHRAMTRE